MIPEEITDLRNGVLIGHVGTRNKDLKGTEVFMWAFDVNPQENKVTTFISQAIAEETLANLADNKKIAVTVTDPMTHRSYQMKGNYVSHYNCNETEHANIKMYIDRFYDNYLSPFGYPAEIVNTFKYMPAIAVTFNVEDIFVQTPGPGAGEKLNVK